MDVLRRFLAKVDKDGPLPPERPELGPCWLWTASLQNLGYGRMMVAAVRIYAHRLAYELFVGPIPEGLEIDHLCRVRHCVRPDHLEPVTHLENVRRGGLSESNRRRSRRRQTREPALL